MIETIHFLEFAEIINQYGIQSTFFSMWSIFLMSSKKMVPIIIVSPIKAYKRPTLDQTWGKENWIGALSEHHVTVPIHCE